jgi:DNA-binding NarL/FixJ family response regulator
VNFNPAEYAGVWPMDAGPIESLDDLSQRQSGVAAGLIDALDDGEIADATGLDLFTVVAIVKRLSVRMGARNRVALALALDRMSREDAA